MRVCVVRPDDQALLSAVCDWYLLRLLHGAIRYYQLKGRSHRYTVRSLEDMCNRLHPVGGCVLGMSTWCVCAKKYSRVSTAARMLLFAIFSKTAWKQFHVCAFCPRWSNAA